VKAFFAAVQGRARVIGAARDADAESTAVDDGDDAHTEVG
jgi:hypothetical protein